MFPIDKGTGQKVEEALLSIFERGEQVLVCPTNMNRLVIGHPESSEADPTSFKKEEIKSIEIMEVKAPIGRLVGEKAVVIEIQSKNGSMALQLPESALDTLKKWLK